MRIQGINLAKFCQIRYAVPIRGAGINYRPNHSHTIYTINNMGQKCEGDCGLWVLNEILKKMYPENLKKIVGAVWEIPAK